MQHIPAVSYLYPRFRIYTRDTLPPCYPTTTLQDGRPTLRLTSVCALQAIWIALVRHLSWQPIRPVLLLGCLSSWGPLGLMLGFYRAQVRRPNAAHFNCKAIYRENHGLCTFPLGGFPRGVFFSSLSPSLAALRRRRLLLASALPEKSQVAIQATWPTQRERTTIGETTLNTTEVLLPLDAHPSSRQDYDFSARTSSISKCSCRENLFSPHSSLTHAHAHAFFLDQLQLYIQHMQVCVP
jgi:hypothetical protein